MLFPRAAGNHHAGWPEQAVFEPIAPASLSNDVIFGNGITGLVRQGIVKIRIEFLTDCFDRLQPVIS